MANWNGRPSRGTTTEMLDHENTRMTEQLAGKVSMLKNYAFDMERETRDSNRYIDSMDGEFDSSSNLLTGSLTRINNMLGTGQSNRRLMCYIIMALVGLFFFAYFLITHVTASGRT